LSREDLSLGERVHLASKDLRGILKPSIWAAIAGLALIGLAMTWTYNTTNVLEEYGYHENHLNAPDGPLCDSLDPIVSSDSDPAMIVLNKGFGAEKAGIQKGDTIIRINDFEIPWFFFICFLITIKYIPIFSFQCSCPFFWVPIFLS